MRPMQSRHTAAVVVVAAFFLCSELCAQMTGPSLRAADVAASLRKNGSVKGVAIVLTQARGPQSQQTMDEIADSLVAIAASFPGNDLRSAQTRLAATLALVQAGKGTSGIVGSDRAVPYSGASVRLMRLVET